MEKLSLSNYFSSKKQAKLLQSIYTEQTSYLLVAPEEIEQMIATAELPADEFVRILQDEMSAGNFRYLLYGQAVSDELLDRIKSAIEKFYPKTQ